MIKFGYTIAYVADVEAELAFFEKAFSLRRRFVSDAGDYGELDTGDCVLAFASHALGKTNLPDGYLAADSSSVPLGVEIGLVVKDPDAAHAAALAAGAVQLREPHQTSWGQRVAWLRSPQGLLIEIGSHPGG